MAHDLTKYSFQYRNENYPNILYPSYHNSGYYPKNGMVLAVISVYLNNQLKENPTFSYRELLQSFPPDLQGSLGVIMRVDELKSKKKEKQFHPEVLKTGDGVFFRVCNQWSGTETSPLHYNLPKFIQQAKKLGFVFKELPQFSKANQGKNNPSLF